MRSNTNVRPKAGTGSFEASTSSRGTATGLVARQSPEISGLGWMMHYDKKVSCALGILLVGIVTALFFRHEKTEATEVPALENPQSLDAKIARKSVRPYDAPSRLSGVIEEAAENRDSGSGSRPYEELPETASNGSNSRKSNERSAPVFWRRRAGQRRPRSTPAFSPTSKSRWTKTPFPRSPWNLGWRRTARAPRRFQWVATPIASGTTRLLRRVVLRHCPNRSECSTCEVA